MKTIAALFVLVLTAIAGYSQFAPPAGEEGSMAIAADSSLVSYWGDSLTISRGPAYIAEPAGGLASHGNVTAGTGPADLNVVSLGDGGVATYFFNPPLTDSPGPDIAVFENSFTDSFLELAFVEISSDGENFIPFSAVSLTQAEEQVGPFGTLDAGKIHNLAGKYRGGFGVPFDFSELESYDLLNIMAITHVRITDVVGSIDEAYASVDSQGNIINDPFPTNFNTGGFDLDAVAVLKDSTQVGVAEAISVTGKLTVYPNPVKGRAVISIRHPADYKMYSSDNRIVEQGRLQKGDNSMGWGHLPNGLYLLQVSYRGYVETIKVVVR